MKLTNILLIIIAICLVVMIINPRPIEIKISKLPEIKVAMEQTTLTDNYLKHHLRKLDEELKP